MLQFAKVLVLLGVVLAACGEAKPDETNPTAFTGPFTTKLAAFPLNSDIQNPLEDRVSV
jgi:hypothetical protein